MSLSAWYCGADRPEPEGRLADAEPARRRHHRAVHARRLLPDARRRGLALQQRRAPPAGRTTSRRRRNHRTARRTAARRAACTPDPQPSRRRAGGPRRSSRSALTAEEMADLVEFLKTLTGKPLYPDLVEPLRRPAPPPDAGTDARRWRRHRRGHRIDDAYRRLGSHAVALDVDLGRRVRAGAAHRPRSPPAPVPEPLAPAAADAADAADDRRRDTGIPLDSQTQIKDLRERMLDLEQRLEQTRQVATARRPIVSVGGYVDVGFFAAGERRRLRPGLRARCQPLLPRVRGPVRLGVPGRHPGARPSTRAARSPTSASAGRRPLRQHQLARRARLHRQRGQPDAERRRWRRPRSPPPASTSCRARGHDFALGDFIDVDIAQLEWMPTALAAHVDLRRQDRLGDRHRVPRAQGQPALRHHAVADRALHDRHARSGLKVRSKFGADDLVVLAAARHQRLDHHRAVPLLRRDRQQRRQDRQRPAVGAARCRRSTSSSALSGEYGPQDRAPRQPGTDVVLGRRPARPLGPVDLKAQWLQGPAASAPTGSTIRNHRPTACDLHSGGYLELDWMITPLSACSGAASFATPASGWATRQRPVRALTGSTSPSPGAATGGVRARVHRAHRAQGRVPAQRRVRRRSADRERRLHQRRWC